MTFRANKGDVFWLELFADRFGFPGDPHAVVQRVRATKGAQGETLYADVLELGDTDANIGDREFNTVTRDAAGTERVIDSLRSSAVPVHQAWPPEVGVV